MDQWHQIQHALIGGLERWEQAMLHGRGTGRVRAEQEHEEKERRRKETREKERLINTYIVGGQHSAADASEEHQV